MPSAFRKEVVVDVVKQIASYNPYRKLILFWNESSAIVYISTEPTYVKENGIPLYPQESIVFDVADADAPESMFFAQCQENSTCTLRIYEALVT